MIRILQQDNRATKAIFAVIIGAAIVTMVVTLVPGIFDNGTTSDSTVFATVRTPGVWGRLAGESTPIRMTDIQREAQGQMRQQRLPEFYLPFLLNRVGQQQVERAVLVREADRLGMQVSDDDLRRELREGPLSQYLFPNGQFIGDDKYLDFVQQYFGISVAQFEKEVKGDLELQRLQALETGGLTVSDAAVRTEFTQQGTKVKFDYAVISASDLKKTVNATDSELEAYFKQNSARYATAVPETRKLQFFTFDNRSVPGGQASVSDADVQAYYNAHQEQYKVPEQVKTRHILIQVAKGGDAKVDAAAKAKAQDALNQVKAGGNFAELAKKYSDDPGSREQGGELPMIPTSGLDPAYGKAAMALNPGQTSDLVRSSFGYHIIQTEAKDAAHTKPLAEVREQIVPDLTKQKLTGAQQTFANQLAAEAKKDGLEKAAAAHSLHVVTTDFLGREGVIASLPDASGLLAAAFTAGKGTAPQTASTGEGYAVFQVVDIKAAHAPSFADWKSHVLDDYREAKAPDLLNAQLKKLDDRAKVLNDLRKASAEMNVPVKSSDFLGREGQVTDLGSLSGAASVVFSLPKNGISGPINQGANGAVLQLLDKQEPSAEDLAKNLPATREKLLNQKRQEVFGVFAGSLMQQYEKAGGILYSKQKAGQGVPLGR